VLYKLFQQIKNPGVKIESEIALLPIKLVSERNFRR
jgi:hypothetical protein